MRQFWDAYWHVFEKWERILIAVTVAIGAVTYFRTGELDTKALETLGLLLLVFLWVCGRAFNRELRKRRNAGITRFRDVHRPNHAFEMLTKASIEYQYVGHSFASCLEPFQKARKHGGMAADARVRLLLADPSDDDLMAFLGKFRTVTLDAAAMRRDLAARLLATLAVVENIGKCEIRTHRERLHCWIHLVDGSQGIVGLLEQGRDGLSAPALELERSKRWNLFDHFFLDAQCLWDRATPRNVTEWRLELEQMVQSSAAGSVTDIHLGVPGPASTRMEGETPDINPMPASGS